MIRRTLLALAAAALLLPAGTASAAEGDFEWQVVGGHNATIQEYPWQAALVFPGSGSAFQRQFCGGVLITPRIVLTAAHCVSVALVPDDPSEVNVVIGRTTLSDADAGEEIGVMAVDIQSLDDPYPSGPPAPQYNPETDENDVGYLVLNAAPAGTTAQTIDIAAGGGGPDDESAVWAPGVFNEVSGWGATAETGSAGSDSLLAASVPIVSDATCASPSYYDTRFKSSSMVCAGYPEG
ncbi:MAG: S1 family serine peptidase, partial [Solirubrobacterales bacterium]